MKFSVRFFCWGNPDRGWADHGYTANFETTDDASGRELVRSAMRRFGWAEGRYQVKFRRHGDGITVEIDMAERPNQLITLMINDPEKRYEAMSFVYVEPVKPMSVVAMRSRLASLGLFLVCLLGVVVMVPLHLLWVFIKPERAAGVAAAIDRAANGALRGNPHETISSRANRARVNGRRWGCLLCKVLDWVKEGHCEDSAGK